MARMHSRAKGKSGSTRPAVRTVPEWVKLTAKEVELLVVKYHKEGLKPSQIGATLRDQYGLPDIKPLCKKSMTQILKEKDLQSDLPEEWLALIQKAVDLKDHLENNKHDYAGKRGIQLTESKIRRLAKYYVRTKRLPATWKYDPKKIKLYVQ